VLKVSRMRLKFVRCMMIVRASWAKMAHLVVVQLEVAARDCELSAGDDSAACA
jgi:hypothetical protein